MSALSTDKGKASTATPVRREASAVRFSARSTWISPKMTLSGIGNPMVSSSIALQSSRFSAELATYSDPTAHFAFVLQVRLTEFRREISFFAKDDAVMEGHSERDDKEQRDPIVKEKAECDLH